MRRCLQWRDGGFPMPLCWTRRVAGRCALVGIGLAAAGLLVSACSGDSGGSVDPSRENSPSSVSYIVVPHPDDEMQAWSLLEDTPEVHKVFIMLTRGEQTAYCAQPGHDEGTGEAPPSPWPQGRWTASCESARQNSFFEFVEAMARFDGGMPASFAYEGRAGPFDSRGRTICRHCGCRPTNAC